jgi:hypothetical protein
MKNSDIQNPATSLSFSHLRFCSTFSSRAQVVRFRSTVSSRAQVVRFALATLLPYFGLVPPYHPHSAQNVYSPTTSSSGSSSKS